MTPRPRPIVPGTPPARWIETHERLQPAISRSYASAISGLIEVHGLHRCLSDDMCSILDLDHNGKQWCKRRGYYRRLQRILLAYHAAPRMTAVGGVTR